MFVIISFYWYFLNLSILSTKIDYIFFYTVSLLQIFGFSAKNMGILSGFKVNAILIILMKKYTCFF